LHAARVLVGLSRDALAERAGLCRHSIRAWERSSNSIPEATYSHLCRAVEAPEAQASASAMAECICRALLRTPLASPVRLGPGGTLPPWACSRSPPIEKKEHSCDRHHTARPTAVLPYTCRSLPHVRFSRSTFLRT